VAWGLLTIHASALGGWLAVPLLGVVIAFHSSLQHEVLHGHPFRDQRLSDALVFPALGLFVAYERFRDTHLAHHHDEILTDPHDDPESNYLDPAVWARLPGWRKALLRANNTLAGRMALGPAIGMAAFYAGDLRAIRAGDRLVRRAYVLHALGLVPVAAWLAAEGTVPAWQYVLGAYLGLSLLKIRTFLEHRAHEKAAGRSVVVEDRGPLALLFLNNNFHAVHHASPRVAWYRLPALYRARRDEVLRRNRGYRYGSYREVFMSYFLRAKDPVPHPLRPGAGEG
jgi:fatty acid desaturase